MSEGVANEEFPAELTDAIVEEFVNRMALNVETAVWQGDSTGSGQGLIALIDGFEKLLADAGDSIDVTGTTLTSSNVLTELNKVYTAIPAGVRKRGVDNVVMFVSYKTAALYRQNLAAQGDNDSANQPVLRLYGIELKECGISDDVIIAGERDNFYFATDLLSDWNDIRLLDQREIDGSDNLHFVLKAKADVQIGFTDEVVYYA
jgi:hypothetical protein